eukprot:TRINITY_DN1613_c0_g3_i1.p1 TRINITY_DN1613_c0_g3~~TRINITY_DN1613_c0_g3_i1.p1  ORF type:complete len:686 (+),score=89.43 TRINITY_DN1613_c0_g3_i1:57-2060(+)
MAEGSWEAASPIVESDNASSRSSVGSSEGGGDGVTIAFEELWLKQSGKTVLRDLCGIMRAGKVTGILAAEKGGADEMMKCISGYLPVTDGRIYANGLPIEASLYRKRVGYVAKHKVDRLSLTVRQSLLFAYFMKTKQPKVAPRQTLEDQRLGADENINCPNCGKVTDCATICFSCGCMLAGWRLAAKVVGLNEVGGQLLSSASEEVRKRVSIAAELLHLPKVLFLEVPTIQLDLPAALRLMKMLRSMAVEYRMTVILTLSQPRRPLFDLLDDVVLLDEGNLAFSGKASGVLPYFQSQNHDVDEFDCPSDYFLDLSCESGNTTYNSSATPLAVEYKQSEHYDQLNNLILEYYQEAYCNITPGISDMSAPSTSTRLFYLLYFKLVGMKNEWRSGLAMLSLVCFLGILAGLVYSQQAKQSELQNTVGMMFFILSALMLGNLNSASDFVNRKPAINHEIAAGYYNTREYITALCIVDILLVRGLLTVFFGFLAYFLMGFDFIHTVQEGLDEHDRTAFGMLCVCMALTQLPFSMLALLVGSLSPNAVTAQYVMIMIFTVFVAFGGLFINASTLPAPLSELQWISILRLSYESLLISEIRGKEFGCETPAPETSNLTIDASYVKCITGDKYLELQGFHEDNMWRNIQILSGVSAAYLMLASLAMWCKRPRYRW